MARIEETIEVGVPVRVAYDQWTQFEEFPRFMEGVQEVRQLDDTHLHWRAEVAGREREWDAEITEQEPDRRIAWRSTGGHHNDGLVSFEPLGEASTRIRVRMDHETEGLAEKAGSAVGLDDRRVKGDLERFRELVESRGAPTGGWRGEVSGGEVSGHAAQVAGYQRTGGGTDLTGDPADDDAAAVGPERGYAGTRLPSLGTLRGMDVRSSDGEKVGSVGDVFLDSEASYVRYIVVRTGWRSRGAVPIEDVTYVREGDDGAHLVIPYSQDVLRAAPAIEEDEELTPEREEAIYDHYRRAPYWDEARDAVRARQTAPAPTPQIAEAEVADAIARGDHPATVRVKRWGR